MSDPRTKHSDPDGLDDHKELEKGWTIDVVMNSAGEPKRWDSKPNQGPGTTIDVFSDPMKRDSDSDGLTDSGERQLHTDPEQKQTYTTTAQRQELLRDLYEYWETAESQTQAYETIEALGVLQNRKLADLEDIELTDATDDFDFVRADDGSVSFLALDNQTRTDTWLSNEREVALAGVDPWDPDSDDDGLTDGQEQKWLTKGIATDDTAPAWLRQQTGGTEAAGQKIVIARTVETEPTTPDTDNDGYWDGWIGVYDVGRTDNVVLYREHLYDQDGDGDATDDGVTGSEAVPKQAGVHEMSAASSAMGTSLYDEADTKYHANIHIGELQWGTTPHDRADAPNPTLSIEVDFYDEADYEQIDRDSWTTGIENNYALYGIDVTIVRDETLSDDDFVPCASVLSPPNCVTTKTFGAIELIGIETRHHSTDADEYVLVGHQGGGPFIPNSETQGGINIPQRPVQGLFVDGNKEEAKSVPSKIVQNSPYNSELALVMAKTEIHEIGHSFGIGEADDRSVFEDPLRKLNRNGEVYSGRSADDTPEYLSGKSGWSIMRSGWDDVLTNSPMLGRYFAYSIEELTTVTKE